jgi:serine/threonine protein kinase
MSTPAPATGQRLGPYQLVSPIGKGGMGEVWKGRDTRLNRDVAIKFSRAEFIRRETARGESMTLIKETQELADV